MDSSLWKKRRGTCSGEERKKERTRRGKRAKEKDCKEKTTGTAWILLTNSKKYIDSYCAFIWNIDRPGWDMAKAKHASAIAAKRAAEKAKKKEKSASKKKKQQEEVR